MATDLPLFGWDACLFYEHLNDEQQDPHLKQGLDDLLDQNAKRENKICTSVITHLEVIPKKLDATTEGRYWGQFQSTSMFDVDLDRNILALARHIKDYYYKPKDDAGDYRMMSSGDAIHLATAIIHKVDAFHTRDKNPKHGNVKLIGLTESSPNGKICGIYDLKVISPTANQRRLDV
jgi:hypothetical protein